MNGEYLLSLDPYNFNTEESIKDYLKDKKIENDIDLLNYVKNNYYIKNNIFMLKF